MKSDEFLEFKVFPAAAVSAAARQSEETTQTIFGSKPENTLENGALEGASAVAERYSKLLLDQIEGDGLYVRVPAGTEFYVYTLQVFEPKLASVAGLKQGQKPRNSWELIDPAKGDPNIKPPSEALEDLLKTLRPVTPAEALKRRDLLTAEVEKHLRNNGQLTESNP
ncbi:MAG: hypothetical protein KDJ43_06970 [Rhizobiaceae bacterium]|nr:hypothetical protein [Rhizobiaceae bacterium]